MTSRFLRSCHSPKRRFISMATFSVQANRSEEHTSELQSQFHLVCRLLLEKKKTQVVDRLKKSFADEFGPHAIDERFGEPRFFFGCHPRGQRLSAVVIGRAFLERVPRGEAR